MPIFIQKRGRIHTVIVIKLCSKCVLKFCSRVGQVFLVFHSSFSVLFGELFSNQHVEKDINGLNFRHKTDRLFPLSSMLYTPPKAESRRTDR